MVLSRCHLCGLEPSPRISQYGSDIIVLCQVGSVLTFESKSGKVKDQTNFTSQG